MDKERARFILGCFRSDGADAADPDFAEALRVAVADRELGEWLTHERAQDAAFAAALAEVEIPSELRDEILTGFAVERGDLPPAEGSDDATFIGALASLSPPDGLREQILAAMERSVEKETVVRHRFWKFAVPLAAAAAVVLGLFLNQGGGGPKRERIPIAAVEAGFLKAFEDPAFELDMKKADHQALFDHLKRRSLPCPCPRAMPPGLDGVAGVGCRVLEIEGHRGSLVCFDERKGGKVHLVVFFRNEVEGELPDSAHPDIDQHGEWAVASWANEDAAFLLLGNCGTERLAALF